MQQSRVTSGVIEPKLCTLHRAFMARTIYLRRSDRNAYLRGEHGWVPGSRWMRSARRSR
jgi:hypothetical protein